MPNLVILGQTIQA